MTYAEVRAAAKDGDVFFLTMNRKNLLSRLTSFVTRSPYTHAAFLFWYAGRLLVVESTTHGGNRIVNASHYHDREVILVPAPRPWTEIQTSALAKVSELQYGWFSAIYIGIREIAFTHFNIKLPPDRNNRYQACSEFVAETLGLADHDLSPGQLLTALGGHRA